MYIPVFGKTVAFTNFASIAVAIRTIMPFDKSSINRAANSRCFYGSCHLGFGTEYNAQINLDHPTFSPHFVNRSILQLWRWNPTSTFGTTGSACSRWRNFLPISLQDSPFVRSVFIRCNQIHDTTASSSLKILHKLLDIFRGAFARHNANDQTVLRIISHMIPVISLLTISRVIIAAVFFFLADKCPLLVELNLACSWGKTPLTHRGLPRHALQRPNHTALPYLGVRPQADWFCGLHSLRRCASKRRWLFPYQASFQITAYPFVRKTFACMCGNRASEYACFCRTNRRQLDFLRPVCRNQDIFYSGSRILKELPLFYLRNVICLWDKHLSLIRRYRQTRINFFNY